MEQLRIPAGYHSPLTIRETEVAIKEVKDHFERALAKNLHLTRVSAPLFVRPESGLNDNLNGVERPVSFDIKEQDGKIAEKKGIYSPSLMKTQIAAIDKLLMEKKYFGE